MFNMLFFVVLIPIAIILMCAFINGLNELYHQELEEKKKMIREGIEGYLDRTFGYGAAKLFNSIMDAEGNLRYIVYLPHYEWFKSPKYKWYEVYAENNDYHYIEMERL